MTDLSIAERSTIEAVVDGVQRRTMKRRKRARQGWAFLLSGALSIPIISASLDGSITVVTAATRIAVALVITTGIVAMVGSLFDSHQGQAAVKTAGRSDRGPQEAEGSLEAATGDGRYDTDGSDGGVTNER